MDILILGAGGQGQTVADALLRRAMADAATRVVGFLDDTPQLQGWQYQGIPVLGPLDSIAGVAHDGVIVAIGDNRARRQIFLGLQARGFNLVSVVHPTAALALDVQMGPGCYVGANAVVGVATRIGANVIVNGGSCIGHHNRIGDHCHVATGANSTRGACIGEGTLVGAGVTVLPGCSIGSWSVVGGGAVVARNVGDGVLAVGSPARAIRRIEGNSDEADHRS